MYVFPVHEQDPQKSPAKRLNKFYVGVDNTTDIGPEPGMIWQIEAVFIYFTASAAVADRRPHWSVNIPGGFASYAVCAFNPTQASMLGKYSFYPGASLSDVVVTNNLYEANTLPMILVYADQQLTFDCFYFQAGDNMNVTVTGYEYPVTL